MQGQGSAAKIGERYRWGATLYLWEKCRGRAGQCSKKLERAFGKMQRQGSAVKNWRALLGGYPSILQEQGSAVKFGERYRWGATPVSLRKTWEP